MRSFRRRVLTLPVMVTLGATVLATSTACMSSTSGAGENTVTITTTGGEFSDVLRTAAFDPFTKKTGIMVKDDSPNNEAKLKAMVTAGAPTWDIFHSSPARSRAYCGKYFEKIDYSVVDKSKLDPSQVSTCGVPLLNSVFLLVYNKKKYGAHPPKSWKDFYDTKRFPGRRGIMNYAKDAGMETALLADGVPGKKLYPLDYDRAFKKLGTIRSQTSFFETGAQQEQALGSGQVDMMLAWPSRAAAAKRSGADIGVVWNQPLSYYDTLAVVKGSPHKRAAMKLINQIVSTQSQSEMFTKLPYSPVNKAAEPKPDGVLKQFMLKYHKNDSVVVRDNDWWAGHLDEASQKWTAWVNR